MARVTYNQPGDERDRDERDDDRFGRGGGGPSVEGSTSMSAPIGVPDDYMASGPPGWHRSMSAIEAGADPGGLPPARIAPRYFDGDQYMPSRFSPAEIWDLQQTLAQIGLLTSPFQREIWDQETANAYAGVLAYANQQGLTEKQALLRMAGGEGVGGEGRGTRYRVDENGALVPITGEGAGPDVPPLTIRKTDPKVLDLVFRKASMEILGQGLGPAERQQMVAAYGQMEEQRQRDLYEAQIRESGTPERTVLDIPSPEAFADLYTQENFGPEREENEAMNFTQDAIQMLGSTAWGVG